MQRTQCAGIVAAVVAFACDATAGTYAPVSVIGYQNASDVSDVRSCSVYMNTVDVTSAVSVQDEAWAPEADGCILYPYFATGTSAHFLDALSANFDVRGAGAPGVAALRAYLRKGTYGGGWHQYRLYPGAFNTEDEDCDFVCPGSYASFPADPSWSGWIEIPVPAEWFVDGQLDVSLRLWNAQVDAVELVIEAVPVELSQFRVD